MEEEDGLHACIHCRVVNLIELCDVLFVRAAVFFSLTRLAYRVLIVFPKRAGSGDQAGWFPRPPDVGPLALVPPAP